MPDRTGLPNARLAPASADRGLPVTRLISATPDNPTRPQIPSRCLIVVRRSTLCSVN
jgi:hypothetical protein